MPQKEDAVLRNARREAVIIITVWGLATAYCCIYCYLFGYIRTGHALGAADVRPIGGVPSWFFWGILAPWAVCAVFTFVFAGFWMSDDDLGADHSAELESDIRDGGLA